MMTSVGPERDSDGCWKGRTLTPRVSISRQCKLVKLSRSAFYYTPVGIDADTLAMMKEIDRVFTRYPFFGSRQIAAYLRREGTVAGRHRVRRLMAKMGLQAIYKRPRTC